MISSGRTATVFLVLAVLAARPARAGDQAKLLLNQGINLFADGAFKQSIRVLRRARAQTGSKELLGEINLYLGLNHASENRVSAARAAFRTALTNNARLRIDPQRHKPEFVEQFEAVRRSMVGELVVAVEPAGREVLIDGEVCGRAPFRGSFLAGRHAVQVRGADGEVIFAKDVILSASQSIRLVVIGREEATSQQVIEPPVRPEAPVAAPSRRRRLWTWIAVGGAVASAAVAIGTALSAGADHDEGCTLLAGAVLPCDQRSRLIRLTDAPRYDDLRQSMSDKTLISNIAIGTTAAFGVAAVLLYWLEGRGIDRESRRQASVQAAVGAGQLSFKIRY